MDVNEGFHLTHVSRVYYGNAPVFVARQYGKPDKLPVLSLRRCIGIVKDGIKRNM